VQVLDNYNNPSYPDGMASSIYGINPPLANPLNAPGEWQSYDIVFRRPIFKDGKEIDPGYITVFVNGVLTQDHTPLEGGGGHMKRSSPRHSQIKARSKSRITAIPCASATSGTARCRSAPSMAANTAA
jgi:hypothetical protein